MSGIINTYSQNSEDLFILNYFGDYKGTLLEIGANDGTTLSNSRLLIENGWFAHLVEPGNVFWKLHGLYSGNENIRFYDVGIGESDCEMDFYESDAHVPNGKDIGLVSTAIVSEKERWPNVNFNKSRVKFDSWKTFYNTWHLDKLDFISIDAEGYDWKILQQIDLKSVGCQALCIEWNSQPDLKTLFTNYCAGFDLKLAHENAENLIFVK